jgi:DNA-binding winged helix-turn-helix (wHTH) protein
MTYRFGDVRVDLGTRQVWRGETEVHMTRRAFELLALLIERSPDAISKPEIHSRLWPDTFVSEVTLQSLVFEVRRGLGDRARKPRFVRTVHGFGYAFCANPSETPASRAVRGWLIGDMGRLPVYEGENVLGRDGEGVVELRSPTVSRRHAILRLGERPVLADLGSKNGTFVGTTPVHGEVPVADGERIRLGAVLLTLRLASPATGSTRTAIPSRADQT